MPVLDTGEARLAYEVRGSGPVVLVPWCNLPWPDLALFARVADRYTVVAASPRGFYDSSRHGSYDLPSFGSDLLAVCDAIGADRFAVLGYSLTTAIAGWLAGATDRVDAVLAGGFPMFGPYAAVAARARADAAALTRDVPFDPAAALAVYDALAGVADDALSAHGVATLAFWGADDDVLDGFDPAPNRRGRYEAAGLSVVELAGCDHVTAVGHLGGHPEPLLDWLAPLTGSGRAPAP